MPKPGPTGHAVYQWVAEYSRTFKRPPTVREVAAGLGCSLVTVLHRYHELELAGRIEREPGIARAVRLLGWRRKAG